MKDVKVLEGGMKAVCHTYPQRQFRRVGTMDRTYKRIPKEGERLENYDEKMVAENVFLVKYSSFSYEMLVHHCEGNAYYKEMTFRESEEGPMYWCEGCGYTLDNGVAMALRLYEAPIS